MHSNTFKRAPTFSSEGGREIAHVPLATGQTATLYRRDLDMLTANGLSLAWTFNPNGQGTAYVRAAEAGRASGGLVGVARLILNAGRGAIVRYRDGNRLNLRRENLYVASGKAARRDRDYLAPLAA